MTILVTGATGAVGRHVISGLLARGERVRAVSRKPRACAQPEGVEVVGGDLSTGELEDGALVGVAAVFVFPAARGVEPFVRRVAETGAPRVVVLSSLAAALEHPRDHGSASSVHHLAVEAAVRDAQLGATVLRPGTFANNLLSWAFSIRQFGAVEGPYPTSRQAPIHESDVAAVAVAALTDDRHRGAVYPMTGPEALSQVEQLDAIAGAVGRELTYHEVTPDHFRRTAGRFVPDDVLTMLLDYWSDTVAEPDVVRSVEPVLGRPGLTLAEWATDHADDFR